ncbi:hypothetical protein B296_00008208 [Ensete ventricosum]|uniref:Uncharacterized protein n=1 Tax=Ensete ventricosum TaxID=4639 RepID=A0A426Z6V6_ENSVE|nr:hypothetical protein B296_00008208 [Ensete ventricosum]
MNVSGRMLDKSTGDVASDGYHKYKICFRDDFTAFADVCFKNFGDRVPRWTTVVEPNIMALGAYDVAILPPNRCGELLTTDASMQLQGMRHLVRNGVNVKASCDAVMYDPERCRHDLLPYMSLRCHVIVRALLRSMAADGLGRVLANKLSSNSLVSLSKDETEDGLNLLYHIRAGPQRVVGKARHVIASELPYKAI